jgi:predicted nucleotide-binding protein
VSRHRNSKEPVYRSSFEPTEFGHYFQRSSAQLDALRQALPNLYGDFQALPVEPASQMMGTGGQPGPMHYSRAQMERLLRDIKEIFEIRAASEHASPIAKSSPRRVFISHGRAKDWYEVQAHIERDLKIASMELAQEANRGGTVIEKLEENSDKCDSAVFVMSGDDEDSNGQVHARENVVHEIGYFQAKYGRRNVVLLHEEGVNIPSNLGGIVYSAYPKGMIRASFGVLDRELRAIYEGL